MNFKENIKRLLEKVDNIEESIIVIKGFSMELLDENIVDVEDLTNNRRTYLKSILAGKEFISYEEFIIFRSNILEIYDKVYIIDNNIYENMYPLTANISNKILIKLEEYFNLEYDKEFKDFKRISLIESYLPIYGNIKCINDSWYVVYSDSILEDNSVEYIDYYRNRERLITKQVNTRDNVDEIVEEEDYIKLLDKLDSVGTYFIKKPSMDLHSYIEKLEIINHYNKEIELFYSDIKEEEKTIEKYEEYLSILQKYWEVENFLKIPNYDLRALEKGIKKTKEISQAEIIDSIVTESDKAIKSEPFNDIFVTAPTGSGKSAMFQIPAIYLGNKYNLMTIVISPLIGLMNDQIKGLQKREYHFVRTIHSDISPVKKQEIMEEIEEGKCHILYISPETLLSRSDVSQLIGSRKIGLFVVDEAHIVTTWGKQFRPDYWFLGDHVKKIRKKQTQETGKNFPIATFTATAIYGGIEDMYSETKDSLYMPNPIVYLGYVKRDNIEINVKEVETVRNRTEYQLDKFESLLKIINKQLFYDRKTLVYFPTVALINGFWDYMAHNKRSDKLAKYHGQMSKVEKEENYEQFYSGDKNVILATKAFGMGIDIEDILTVIHFAPTGNVCDYIQEIGRAARKKALTGRAYYEHMKNDFKYINRFHGISQIKKYQLVQVIEKIYDLFYYQINDQDNRNVGKKQEMLIDAESFSHIFENDFFDEDDAINKVKTSILIIQKDFEKKLGYSPIYMRPIPIFNNGYFYIEDKNILYQILKDYKGSCKVKDKENNIIDINLGDIWECEFKEYTFPQFKYLLYTKSDELDYKYKNDLIQALIVDIKFSEQYDLNFNKNVKALEDIVYDAVRSEKYYSYTKLTKMLSTVLGINKYKASILIDSFLTTMKYFSREYSRRISGKMYGFRESKKHRETYRFNNSISEYFKWIRKMHAKVNNETVNNKLYIINRKHSKNMKEVLLFLGLMESFDLLSFKSLGGNNSRIYLHINQTQYLKEIKEKPDYYNNRILEIVDQRHKVSVEMLNYLFENEFTSDEIWEYIEDYFLGILPKNITDNYKLGSS